MRCHSCRVRQVPAIAVMPTSAILKAFLNLVCINYIIFEHKRMPQIEASQRNKRLCFIYFFTVDDGGNNVGLGYLLDVIVQEVAVEDRHIGNLAELDRA